MTGDAGNHSLLWMRDGINAPTTNSPTEVDAVAAPGIYALALTAAECETLLGTLGGASSTPNVSIIPSTVSFSDASTGAEIANAVWAQAGLWIAELTPSLVTGIVGRTRIITRYYGDSDSETIVVTSDGAPVDLTPYDLTLIIGEQPHCDVADALVVLTSDPAAGIVVSAPETGTAVATLTDKQLEIIGLRKVWYTLKATAGASRQVLLHGNWNVLDAHDPVI
jgi:hypothetical protein